VPILLDGTPPDALRYFFTEEPLAVRVDLGPSGIAQAMPDLLSALGHRLPNDPELNKDVKDRPVEELTLEITDPFLKAQGKVTRAAATARLVKPSRRISMRNRRISITMCVRRYPGLQKMAG